MEEQGRTDDINAPGIEWKSRGFTFNDLRHGLAPTTGDRERGEVSIKPDEFNPALASVKVGPEIDQQVARSGRDIQPPHGPMNRPSGAHLVDRAHHRAVVAKPAIDTPNKRQGLPKLDTVDAFVVHPLRDTMSR